MWISELVDCGFSFSSITVRSASSQPTMLVDGSVSPTASLKGLEELNGREIVATFTQRESFT